MGGIFPTQTIPIASNEMVILDEGLTLSTLQFHIMV